ncbi:glycosyltransferase [Haloplanus rubicundus]|uniref:Glycosyltransferase n=1 Tax=Haloplanus rubicundus TaxID=1547898 RepID=A0A345EG02_9EURY|nr:glycosyltransferase [Haloplanus rubicundus]AXG11124.1 glycosyltransferase [Haloplanus rubicundus]
MTERTGGDDAGEEGRLAVAHWGEHADGGGDRLAWELVRAFDAPFYVGWHDDAIEPDDIDGEQLIDGPLLSRALERGGVLRQFAHLLGWQVASPLRQYDVLVTSGNEPLFYVPPDDQTWVAYVHHTNRRQSDQITEATDGRFTGLKLLLYYAMRVAYDHNTHKPDLFVVNSEVVKRRVVRYWGVPEDKVRVVYPPVETDAYDPEDAETGDYYLTLSRLDWHKDIDGIVEAFNQLDRRLIVAGDGPERERLEAMADDNVEFAGFVPEAEKRELLAGAKAFVFNARDEDFGIAPVEALAAGTPLLGVDEGMTQFQVVPGKNGYRHTRSGSGPSLSETVERFEADGVEWSPTEIAAFADRFSVAAFHEGMCDAVDAAVERARITPSWYESYAESDGGDRDGAHNPPTR